MPGVIINKNYCKGCELCTKACPQGILSMSKDITMRGYFYAMMHDPSRCIGCQLCAITCPDAAITVKMHGTRFVLYEY